MWRFAIKKLIFSVLIMAAVLFLNTCDSPAEGGEDRDDTLAITNVVYSSDGKTMTIYLDGNAPVPQSRAINHELAKLGHNFFEVVFKYNDGTTDGLVKRASWELGEPAGISGLYRNFPGIDYSSISPSPSPNMGSSLLFVGLKADRTLLAVGRLTKVDDTEINFDPSGSIIGTVPLITPSTQSVTFTVTSLEAGVHMDADKSSFKTAVRDTTGVPPYSDVSSANTRIISKQVGPQAIPYFLFEKNTENLISAEYEYTLYSHPPAASPPPPYGHNFPFDIDDFIPSIIRAGPGVAGKKQPRYTLNNGGVFTPPGDLDTRTQIVMTNNQTSAVFENPVKFTIDASSTPDGMIFGLVFEVPVYALTSAGGPVTWYIRPGYGISMYDLDTGRGDSGGAIFMGTGDLTTFTGFRIRVVIPPPKWQYNKTTPDLRLVIGNENLDFDYVAYINGTPDPIIGLRVILETLEGEYIRYIPHDELKFYIGEQEEVFPGEDIPNALKGFVPVTVRYYDVGSGITYNPPNNPEVFYILVGDTTALNPANVLVREVSNYSQFESALVNTTLVDGGTMIVILRNSFDITTTQTINSPVNSNRTYIIIADVPNIVIGRGTTAGSLNHYRLQFTSGASFYFGTWPFYNPVPGYPITFNTNTYPYTINAAGTGSPYSSLTPYTPTGANATPPAGPPLGGGTTGLPNFMFQGPNGGNVNVQMANVNVHWKGLLYYHIPVADIGP